MWTGLLQLSTMTFSLPAVLHTFFLLHFLYPEICNQC